MTKLYDGILTDNEKSYVTSHFGILESSSKPISADAVGLYLVRAQKTFLESKGFRYPESRGCDPLQIGLQTFNSSTLGDSFVLSGRHYCGFEYGTNYALAGLELSIASQPDAWIFFVEGYRNRETDRSGEGVLFEQIAKRLNIPITNPLPAHTLSLEVITETSKRNNHDPKEYMAAIIFGAFTESLGQGSLTLEDVLSRFQQILANASREYKIAPAELERAFYAFVGKRDQESVEDFWTNYFVNSTRRGEIDERATARVKELVVVSNQLNQEGVIRTLKANPTRQQAFFQVGGEHVEMVQSIYKK